MTVPNERTNAVKHTRSFLLDLTNPQKTPRIPKAIRQRALSLLRHYPNDYEMDTIADREDGTNAFPNIKVFGKGWQ